MSELLQRSLTGVAYVVIVVLSTIIHPYLFALVFAGFMSVALLEFYSLYEKIGASPQKTVGLLLSLALFLFFFLSANGFIGNKYLWIITLLPPLLLLGGLFHPHPNSLTNCAATALGIFYVALPLGLLHFLLIPAKLNYYPGILLGIFLIIWMYDSMAYLVGSTFGKHKICTKISPGKSWEGLIGGAVFAVIMGLLNAVIFNRLDMLNWVVIALLIIVFGTSGDFFESKLKREAGVKDSGGIMPGHGGMLDRFDSLLFAAPVIFVWLHLFGKL